MLAVKGAEGLLLAVQLELRASVVWQEYFITLLYCYGNGVTTCERSSALADSQYLTLIILQRNKHALQQCQASLPHDLYYCEVTHLTGGGVWQQNTSHRLVRCGELLYQYSIQ